MTLTGHIVGTKGNTGRGIASIVENADYTITINLTDGSSYTTAPIAGFTAVEFDENYDLVVTKTDGTTETVETDIADYNTLLEGYKSEAYSYMQGAVNSASSASSSATSASGSATDAATYKGEAYNYMTSAQTAKTAAEYAQGKAEDAQSAAETAQGKAEDAQDAAETAQGKAETAQTAAETAKTSAQASATSASSSATSASTSASVATTKASEASSSATAAAGSASAAAASAEAAAESAASLTVDDEISSSSTNPVQNKVIKGELDTKANIDGAYEAMTVGNAEQLVSTVFVNDEEPYNFRTAGGSADIGDRLYDTIVGGTVGWNQLIPIRGYDVTTTEKGVTLTDNRDGTYTLNGTATAKGSVQFISASLLPTPINHVFVMTGFKTVSGAYMGLGGIDIDRGSGGVWKNTSEYSSLTARIDFNSGTVFNGEKIQPQFFDLTQMFGSTIADYIYLLEQANAGAGVAWFRKLFPKPYYAYNAGELMSVNTSAHNTVGFNAWDEEWELGALSATGGNATSSTEIRSKNYIPVVGGQTYYLYCAVASTFNYKFYDADKNFISGAYIGRNNTLTIPNDARYMRFYMGAAYGTTYKHDICINLSWDGERDGEYEAYKKWTYPLDSDLELRGIPKLDASNNLYYDGDTYASDGTVTRDFVEVDLANATASTTYTGDVNKTVSITLDPQFPQNYSDYAFIPEKYVYRGHVNSASAVNNPDTRETGLYAYHNSQVSDRFRVYIVLPKADSISGKLVYRKATETTESADPFQSPQIVDDFGTEEYVDYAMSEGDRDVAIPVGHITKYTNNLRAKLEMSPNSPDGAGDYLVRQTNGINEYVPLASNATIQDIIARLEALEGGGE